LYNDPTSPPEYAVDMPNIEWFRPSEIAPDKEEARMFRDGA
jgi:hypothetical protein